MKDRISAHPGRMKLTDTVSGEVHICDVEMADDPTEVGTAQNKALFDFTLAAIGTTAGTGTAYTLAGDGGFTLTDGATIKFKLHADSGATPTINVNSTGAKALMSDYYTPMAAGIKAGTWLSAAYCADFDFFVLLGSGAKFVPYFHISTASESITIADSGVYRITAIGAGADGYGSNKSSGGYFDRKCDGGAGGGGYLETRLTRGDSLAITIGTSASVSKGGVALITATAGGWSGTGGNTPAPQAGSVSGTGVVAFSSNGTATKSISAPSAVYSADKISTGGAQGMAKFSQNGTFSSNGSAGGDGLYGGEGGQGGIAYCYRVSSTTHSGATTGSTGHRGAGNGGNAFAGYVNSVVAIAGSGGGGGYGGGGGAPQSYTDADDWTYHKGWGYGAAACVVIERIS